MKGLDLSYAPPDAALRRFAADLRREGFGFVVRYLSRDPGKNLRRAEVIAYRREGLDIVTVYEDTADAILGGPQAGREAAKLAAQQLDQLGAPEHAPVYFAADFPVTPEQMPAVDGYLNATAVVLTENCNGIYGSYAAVSQAQFVRYRWQTAAWSAGAWSPSDEMRQYAQGGVTDGIQWDLDVSLPQFADFGQWRWAAVHQAPAKPKRKPVRKAVKKAAGAVNHKVAHEPVVTYGTAAGGLMAAMTTLAAHAGLHLTPVQTGAILTALPALFAFLAAFRVKTEHAFQVAVAGLAAAASTAAAAFGYAIPAHLPLTWIGSSAPVIAAGIAYVVRAQVSPKAAPVPVPVPPAAPVPVAPA